MKNASIEELKAGACCNVWNHLLEFTGLSEDELSLRIRREGNHHFMREFEFYKITSDRERAWYYKHNTNYLFANAVHKPWPLLQNIDGTFVLDFGAGAGNDSMFLARKGYRVATFEPNVLQQAFIYSRESQELTGNLNLIQVLYGRHFDAIICRDVLEHIPDCDKTIHFLADKLRMHGKLYENSPFQSPDASEDVHLYAPKPLEQMMNDAGLESVASNIWEKVR